MNNTLIFALIAAFSVLELMVLGGVLFFYLRLRRSEAMLNALQGNQEALLARIEMNARLEREIVATFAQRQAELQNLDEKLEERARDLRRLLETLNSNGVCFCFDTGHFNVFARAPLEDWMEQLGRFIGHLHLHDNFGKFDEHLPVGNATFPFERFFAALKDLNVRPTITLEAHAQEHLWQSLENLQKTSYLDGLNL